MKGAVAFLVEVTPQEKTVRINITARQSQIAEIDRRATAAKLSRSAYIVNRALVLPDYAYGITVISICDSTLTRARAGN
jgi:hypothetical protein